MNRDSKKNIYLRMILGTLIVIFFVIVFSKLFLNIESASAQFNLSLLKPFGGTLIQRADFTTCSCGFAILTVYDKTTRKTIRILYPWILQVTELLLKLLDKTGIPMPPIPPSPKLYLWYNIFTPNVAVLGQYIPYANGPCAEIIPSPPYCKIKNVQNDGYLFQMGTSRVKPL